MGSWVTMAHPQARQERRRVVGWLGGVGWLADALERTVGREVHERFELGDAEGTGVGEAFAAYGVKKGNSRGGDGEGEDGEGEQG
jgi:hypothetical protein